MSGEILEREIFEQPGVVESLIRSAQAHVRQVAESIRGTFDYVVIAARGTSDNAARYGQYILGARNGLPVGLATPSLFTLYRAPPKMSGAIVVGLSQSGCVPDVIEVLREGKRQGCPTLALTNDPHSLMAQVADHVILLHAGEEKAVAATKTYVASLAVLAMLSAFLDNDQEALSEIAGLPALLESTLSEVSPLLPRIERYRYLEHIAIIGRGFNYATAFEISLKMKEVSRIVAEPYSSADFLHGPIAMLRPTFTVMAIAPWGKAYADMRALIQRLCDLQSELILISNSDGLLERAVLGFPLPRELPEWLSPLAATIPGQLFALALARAKGLDPDRPTGLTKVTETW